MRVDAFLIQQRTHLAIANQSPFLLTSLALLHLSGGFPPFYQFITLWCSAILAIAGFQLTMDSIASPTPDLASILRTLASYTPTRPYHTPQPLPQQVQSQGNNDLEEGEYDPSEYDPSSYNPSVTSTTTPYPQAPPPQQSSLDTRVYPTSVLQQQQPPFDFYQQQAPPPTPQTQQPPPEPQPYPTPIPQQQYPRAPPAERKPSIPPQASPSTITTWPSALRHITSRTASDPAFTQRIHHLIKTQHTHERQWWASRLSLLSTLSSRSEKKRKLDSVLNSIGGQIGPAITSELSAEKEIEIFDKKVHRACKQMFDAALLELEKLEVPFFCTARGLVVKTGEGRGKGVIDEEELWRLRGKIMELLEDLCGEEAQREE